MFWKFVTGCKIIEKIWQKNINIKQKLIDKSNYKIVKISKVSNKVIEDLIDNLKLGLSEDFFISFESLLKLGKRAKSAIETQYNHMDDDHNFRKEIFNFLLNCMDEDIANLPLERLYHPDFIIRANTIMQLEREDSLKYLDDKKEPYLYMFQVDELSYRGCVPASRSSGQLAPVAACVRSI